MILVRRDLNAIPKDLLDKAVKAQQELENLPAEKRKGFIKSKSKVWREFSSYLANMSYGKCWYSESKDPQSFFDVDHFRPKCEVRRSDTEIENPGYDWLAFSWDNFRYSATRSNRLNKNDDTEETDGKGCWFPLLDGSPKATWVDRCVADERAVLLDPINPLDVLLVEVMDDGRIGPSLHAVGTARHRVERSCQIYGLNLPRIASARKRLIREIQQKIEDLVNVAEVANSPDTTMPNADRLPAFSLALQLREKTEPSSEYSLAARAALQRGGVGYLCA